MLAGRETQHTKYSKQGYRAVGKFSRSLFKYYQMHVIKSGIPIHELPGGGFRRRELKRVGIPTEPVMLESLVQPVQRGLKTGQGSGIIRGSI